MTITTLEDILESSEEDTVERFGRYVNPELISILEMLGLDRPFVEAKDVTIVDLAGEEYLDFLAGFGSLNLGHNPSAVIEAVERVETMPNLLQASIGVAEAGLAETLAAVTPGDLEKSFFCNSGAEAVEGALKLARISTGRTDVLSTEGSFHGKTFGALSVTGREKYRAPFEPTIPGVEMVPYGDVDALADALRSGSYAAFVVEPIQGEGGIVVPPEGYLKRAEDLCRETGTLLIVDEIQTGLGRTGALFACDHEDVEPDIMTMAKSLGGGVEPLGAYIATDDVWSAGYGSQETALLHTSTFGGNTRACAAGLKAIERILDDGLPERAAELGERFLADLRTLADEHKLIEEVRGRGLMVGLEFYEPLLGKSMSAEYLGAMFASLLFEEYNVVTAYTLNNPNVIRFEPPLTVQSSHLDRVVEAVDELCARKGGAFGVASSVVGKRFSERLGR